MTMSGDFSYSGDFTRSGEYQQSGELLTEDIKSTVATSKAAFKQLKEKYANLLFSFLLLSVKLKDLTGSHLCHYFMRSVDMLNLVA